MKKTPCIFFLLLCCAVMANAQVNIIQTIANVDTGAGYNGDNIPATAAELYYPEAVCFDKSGNLLIADVGNQRIRKIDMTTNIITTVAGRDTFTCTGDGGPATNASFWDPVDVFVDTSGNIFIADFSDIRIRKIVVSTGIINTIVGNGTTGYSGDNGPATNAELNGPGGVFVDKNGDIFIADSYNNVVRKVNGSTGVITTFAGNGSYGYSGNNGPATAAKFSGPVKICCDHSGNVYISDQYNSVVRKVNTSTGIVTNFAGNGTAGYSGDNGPATNAELYRPGGLYLDAQNNLYVTEFGNGVVRRIDGTTGIISTVAGTGVWGYTGDGGPATAAQMVPTDAIFDNQGNMIIADYDNQCIRKVYRWALGLSNQNMPSTLNIYPNPTSGKFAIETTASNDQKNIEIIDILGNTVYSSFTNTPKTEIDISSQPPGIDMLHLTNPTTGERLIRKIVKE